MISLIWAMNDDWIIGLNNKIPWYEPEDLKHFKNYTKNKTIVMGRKTFESIGCKPLMNRKNIVVSRTKNINFDSDVQMIDNLIELFEKWKNSNEELVVVGGAQIYKIAFNYAKKLIVSIIKYDGIGDVYFPIKNLSDFKIEKIETRNNFKINFYIKKEL